MQTAFLRSITLLNNYFDYCRRSGNWELFVHSTLLRNNTLPPFVLLCTLLLMYRIYWKIRPRWMEISFRLITYFSTTFYKYSIKKTITRKVVCQYKSPIKWNFIKNNQGFCKYRVRESLSSNNHCLLSKYTVVSSIR